MRTAIARSARWLGWVIALACTIGACVSLVILSCFEAALPQLDGVARGPGLQAPVTIQRDRYGIVSIDAMNRADALLALGYVHAQDRFFQMDLARRAAAGELAELLGIAAFPLDRERRLWRMRALAKRQLALASDTERSLLRAYTRGVNAGLASLSGPPVEYLFLRQQPRPWADEDSLLAVHEMFFTLAHPEPDRRVLLAQLKELLRPDMYAFLTSEAGEWDSPLLGLKHSFTSSPIPYPVADHRTRPTESRGRPTRPAEQIPGSSAWVISGRLTASHRALLALDMHLPLSVPNTWYRAQLRFRTGSAIWSVYGITLPGFPGITAGSNGEIAWGFSNSQGQWADALRLQPCQATHWSGYLLDAHCVPYGVAQETIAISGEPDRTFHFRTSVFGVVTSGSEATVPQWLGARLEATNLHFLDIAMARTVDEALDAAARAGVPPVNFVVADKEGRIGWTLAGQLPVWSIACDAPTQLANRSNVGWRAILAPDRHPKLRGDGQNMIVAANQRILADDSTMCDGGFDIGARAQRIERLVAETPNLDESALWRIQLDTKALFLERWHDLLMYLIAKSAAVDPRKYGTLYERLKSWGDHASVDSVGYRFVREFRDAVVADLLSILGSEADMGGEELNEVLAQAEYPVWRLVSEQPPQWLPTTSTDWNSYLMSAVDRLLLKYQSVDPDLSQTNWGSRNMLDMRHPIFGDWPVLGRIFRAPPVPLSGDVNMPRVQAPSFGASERLVVSPGAERLGLLSMPGGQSENPLSPFFDRGHENWVNGSEQPFVAGPAEHTLHLRP